MLIPLTERPRDTLIVQARIDLHYCNDNSEEQPIFITISGAMATDTPVSLSLFGTDMTIDSNMEMQIVMPRRDELSFNGYMKGTVHLQGLVVHDGLLALQGLIKLQDNAFHSAQVLVNFTAPAIHIVGQADLDLGVCPGAKVSNGSAVVSLEFPKGWVNGNLGSGLDAGDVAWQGLWSLALALVLSWLWAWLWLVRCRH